MVQPELPLDSRFPDFHVTVVAGSNEFERRLVVKGYEKGIERVVVMSPFDGHVGPVLFFVDELAFDVYDDGGIRQKVRTCLLLVRKCRC